MQFSILSPSTLFRIHYDTLGLNAVPPTDNDRNGIPDFVDSAAYYMDAAYRFCIDTLGYRSPPRDYVDSSAWDVYLVQLGRVPGFYFNDRDLGQFGWYGATYAEDLIPLHCGGYASTGFIFLDNDYSSQDSIGTAVRRATYSDTGIVALKITCYHEFHHLVQYGYFYGASPAFYEMTSVWIEQRAFPTITNYTQYVRRLFANPTLYCLSCDRSIEGSYGYSIALRYLALQLGDDLIRAWWENIGQCSPHQLPSIVLSHYVGTVLLICGAACYHGSTGLAHEHEQATSPMQQYSLKCSQTIPTMINVLALLPGCERFRFTHSNSSSCGQFYHPMTHI